MAYLKRFQVQFLLVLGLMFLGGIFFTKSTVHAKEKFPYYIKVNKQQNTVTIYELDENGAYTVPVKAMICSVGYSTPLGTYKTPIKYRWKLLNGDVWGQYSTRVVGGILFHSVYYYKPSDPTSLSWSQYNKLGMTASQGCIRLTVEDAKWIYDNCPIGTTVEIYNGKDAGPLGKPVAIKLKAGTGWDPTDPNPKNPFKDKKPSIKGAKNLTIEWGSKLELKAGITALNTAGYDITSKMVIEGKVDAYKVGKQKVTYSVTDEIGRSVKKTITITVKETKEPPRFTGIKDRGISMEQVVDREFALTGIKAYLSTKEISQKSIDVKIAETEEGFLVTYSVKGSNGLKTTQKANFYKDNTPPYLSGISHKELTKKQVGLSKANLKKLALEGVTVTDDYTSLSKEDIKVSIKAKEDYAFIVTYSVADTAGNVTEEIVQFTYFKDVRIEGVSNVYNLPYGTKVTKPLVSEGIVVLDSDGNDITDDMAVTLSSYADELYKVTYKVYNDEGNLISVVAYFTVMLEPEIEESETEEYEDEEDTFEEDELLEEDSNQ